MYLVDADVLIQAKNRHYGFDFCPAFWDWIDHAFDQGLVASVDQIGAELRAGADELADWAQQRGDFFAQPDAAVLSSLRSLSDWASSASSYTDAARNTFLGSGDLYLIGHAHAYGHTVVTHEVPQPNARKRIKIPDACNGVGVRWTDPFGMLRNAGARFDLGA